MMDESNQHDVQSCGCLIIQSIVYSAWKLSLNFDSQVVLGVANVHVDAVLLQKETHIGAKDIITLAIRNPPLMQICSFYNSIAST